MHNTTDSRGSEGADEAKPRSPEPDGREPHSNEHAWTFVLIGIVLLIATVSYFWLGPTLRKKKPASDFPTTASGVPQITPAMVPLVTGEEPIDQLFVRAGCAVCHTIPGIPGADGRVGPKLVLGLTGPSRLADPGYRGQAKTVREYVIESILTPGAYVVPGYPGHVMPRWYGQKLSAGALEKVAVYLEALTEEPPPRP